jgi:hypothetical protein
MRKFNERFNIEVGTEEAKHRFVHRVYNRVFLHFIGGLPDRLRQEVIGAITNALGVKIDIYTQREFWDQVGEDFFANLQAIEAMHRSLQDSRHRTELEEIIVQLFSESEVDLGARWKNGEFLPSGAPMLDEKLVNDVLGMFTSKKYEGALTPFHKGLDLFLHSTKKPELLLDVITDMFEALEALAKIVTGKDAKLDANQELFIATVKASGAYKPILKAYIAYAHAFRHAAEKGQKKAVPSHQEVESFIYLTGLFLRLAMSS